MRMRTSCRWLIQNGAASPITSSPSLKVKATRETVRIFVVDAATERDAVAGWEHPPRTLLCVCGRCYGSEIGSDVVIVMIAVSAAAGAAEEMFLNLASAARNEQAATCV